MNRGVRRRKLPSRALLVTAWSLALACAAPPARTVPVSGVEEQLGARLPLDEHFTTSKGERVLLREFFGGGKPGLLVLSYAQCAMLCGVVLNGVSELLRDFETAPGERFSVVNISIDPRETPHHAARVQATALARAGYPGAVEHFPFLVGEQRSIDAVAGTVGFRYAWDPPTQQYAHPSVLFVIAKDGTVARYFHGVRFEPAAVRDALFGRERTSLGRSIQAAVLSCFRGDVLERRYGGAIAGAFRIGGLLVLVALVGLVVVCTRRGRAQAPGRRGRA